MVIPKDDQEISVILGLPLWYKSIWFILIDCPHLSFFSSDFSIFTLTPWETSAVPEVHQCPGPKGPWWTWRVPGGTWTLGTCGSSLDTKPVGIWWVSGVVEYAGHIWFRAQGEILYQFLYLQDVTVSYSVDHVEYVNLGLSHFSIAVRDNRDILWPLVDS